MPYPKYILEEALNDISKMYFDSGNKELSKAIQNTIPFLLFYKDDETAFKNSVFCFSIPQMTKTLGDSITRFKNEWAEWIKKREVSTNSFNENPEAISKTPLLPKTNQDYAIQYHNNGVDKFEIKDYLGAIQDYTKAIELDPQNANAYFGRGDAMNSLNNHYGAFQDYTKAIELNPKYMEAYFNRGNGNYQRKDYLGAIQDYSKAIEINPKFKGAFINRGLARIASGDKDGACLDFKKASDLGHAEAADLIEKNCK